MSAPDFIVNSYILSSISAYMSTFFKVLDEASAKNSDELHLKADSCMQRLRIRTSVMALFILMIKVKGIILENFCRKALRKDSPRQKFCQKVL